MKLRHICAALVIAATTLNGGTFRAQTEEPRSGENWINRSQYIISLREVDEAAAQQVDRLFQQGEESLELGNYTQSEAIWRRIISLDPNNIAAHTQLAEVLYRQGKLHAASETFQRAIELIPLELDLNDAGVNTGLALGLANRGQVDEAIVLLHRATDLDPTYAPAFTSLGMVLDREGRQEEAIANYQRSILLDLENPWPYYHLGNLMVQQGDMEGAIATYQAAIDNVPKFTISPRSTSVVLLEGGQSR